jgi:hypothetical protein
MCSACGLVGPRSVPTTAAPATTTVAPPKETAEAALRRQFLELSRAQYGLAWDEIVPVQQAIVPRDRFIDCQSRSTAVGVSVTVNQVVETYLETIQVPGTLVTMAATALTVNVSVGAGKSKQTATTTLHEFAVAGKWRWSLAPASADDYKAGVCPP